MHQHINININIKIMFFLKQKKKIFSVLFVVVRAKKINIALKHQYSWPMSKIRHIHIAILCFWVIYLCQFFFFFISFAFPFFCFAMIFSRQRFLSFSLFPFFEFWLTRDMCVKKKKKKQKQNKKTYNARRDRVSKTNSSHKYVEKKNNFKQHFFSFLLYVQWEQDHLS